MAKVRIGYGTDFSLENELVGIGTDTPAKYNLDLTDSNSNLLNDYYNVGVATMASFTGFLDNKQTLRTHSIIDNRSVGSISAEIIIDGEVTVSSGSTIISGVETLTVTDNFTLPGITDDKPTVGTTRFNENLASLEFYTGVEWRAVNSRIDMNKGDRAILHHGITDLHGSHDQLDYFKISSQGNAVEFGELTVNRFQGGRSSSSTRGLFGGGQSSPALRDVIDYVTMASEGKAIEFGTLSAAGRTCGGASSSTRGIFAGVNKTNVIDYVEIATTGNGNDFGDLVNSSGHKSDACSSPTRLLYHSGSTSPRNSLIEYLTIASKGHTRTFGDITYAGHHFHGSRQAKATSNQVRGIFAGGYQDYSPYPTVKNINYVTIASEGNAIDFGELTTPRYAMQCTGSQTRGILGGGGGAGPGWVKEKVIDYIEFASTGNAIVFGDLTAEATNGTANSDCHGGLGGF